MNKPTRYIDNDIYNADGDIWRQPDSPFYLLQCSVNPARIGYLRKVLPGGPCAGHTARSALDVGCGGGILSEALAKMGFAVTGIDPSAKSLGTASVHAKAIGLKIKYVEGFGEKLPVSDASSDAVFCCDVLEHVRDTQKVVSEIRRVLKPGGCFFYDTINRTLLSRLVAIDVAQNWKRWAFAPPELHNWTMFIRPDELKALLEENGLEWKEHVGMNPNVSFPRLLCYLRRRAKGAMTYGELGEKIYMLEGGRLSIMYMGYAVKK